MRQIDFLDGEIAILERGIAEHALESDAVKRLMTVPGVSMMTATTFMAAVGDIRRFRDPRQLVSYLGLDPTVRQSGSGAARHGRISKQGASQVRHMLAEAAFVAVSTAGPMRSFYERVRARRGHQIAIVAVARKLTVLLWHLLTREQDYAYQRPSLTRKSSAALSWPPAPSASPDDATSRPRTPTASAPSAPASASSPNTPKWRTAASSPTGRQRRRRRRPPGLDFHPCSSSGSTPPRSRSPRNRSERGPRFCGARPEPPGPTISAAGSPPAAVTQQPPRKGTVNGA